MAKYDSLRKLKRNQELREYKERHPELSQREISLVYNISPSRVSRILNQNQSITRSSVVGIKATETTGKSKSS